MSLEDIRRLWKRPHNRRDAWLYPSLYYNAFVTSGWFGWYLLVLMIIMTVLRVANEVIWLRKHRKSLVDGSESHATTLA